MPDSSTEQARSVAPFSPYVALRHLVRGQPLTVGPGASVRETLLRWFTDRRTGLFGVHWVDMD